MDPILFGLRGYRPPVHASGRSPGGALPSAMSRINREIGFWPFHSINIRRKARSNKCLLKLARLIARLSKLAQVSARLVDNALKLYARACTRKTHARNRFLHIGRVVFSHTPKRARHGSIFDTHGRVVALQRRLIFVLDPLPPFCFFEGVPPYRHLKSRGPPPAIFIA